MSTLGDQFSVLVGVTAETSQEGFGVDNRTQVGFGVRAESGKDSLGWDLVAQTHREPVLQEQVDSRTKQAALRDLVAPPVLIEVLPIRCAPCVDVSTDQLALLENVVLDEVRG